jgi:ABC-type sugar transport system substrate-binding protein
MSSASRIGRIGAPAVPSGLAGAWLAQASKGNCNIVEEQGTTGSAPAIERKKGFEAVISNFPNMKIVKTQRRLHDRRRQEGDGGLHQVDRQSQGRLRVVRA